MIETIKVRAILNQLLESINSNEADLNDDAFNVMLINGELSFETIQGNQRMQDEQDAWQAEMKRSNH